MSIQSKRDLIRFLEADRIALKRESSYGLRAWLRDPIWTYERVLRKREYYLNTKGRNLFKILAYYWYTFRHETLGLKLGFSIFPNTIDEGLASWHYGSIVISNRAKIGKRCMINICVNIGKHREGVPKIGDDCCIGPGAKLFGDIIIGNNTKIGANAVVNKSFPEGNCTLVGAPAHRVKTIES